MSPGAFDPPPRVPPPPPPPPPRLGKLEPDLERGAVDGRWMCSYRHAIAGSQLVCSGLGAPAGTAAAVEQGQLTVEQQIRAQALDAAISCLDAYPIDVETTSHTLHLATRFAAWIRDGRTDQDGDT